jgi:hypothetical protein
MHLKVFLKLKNPKNSLFWVKKNKKTQKTPKTPKKQKKPTGLVFFLKTRVFSNPVNNGNIISQKVCLLLFDF